MSFKSASPQIYATMNVKGEFRKWMDNDIFKRLAALAGGGWYWDSATMTLKKPGPQTIALETPWIHCNVGHSKNCNFDHHIAFTHFHIIPPKCQSCWKVCMGLPDFESLMFMEELQTSMEWPCKCGIELRDYTTKKYGAYFYTNSLEEGRERYQNIVDIVSQYMTNGKEIAEGIILKRGCTEFEMIKGPSPYWHMTAAEEKLYEMLISHVDLPKNQAKQPDIMKNYVRQNWILWAHSHGDMSYLKWNDNTPLFPDYVKYHKGDIEEIKKDMADALESVQPKTKSTEELPTVHYEKEVIGEQDELT